MRWGGFLSVAALVLSSCRREAVPAEAPDRARWHARSGDAGCIGLPGDHRELAVLDLPEALHASRDAPRTVVRGMFIANLQPEDALYFKGNTWLLRDEHAERSLDSLRSELRKLTDPRGWAGSALPELSLLFRADASTRWRTARLLLDVVRAPELRLQRLRIAVENPHDYLRECNGYLSADWRAAGEAAASLPVALEPGAEGDRVLLRLRAGDRVWEFARKALRDGSRVWLEGIDLAAANRVWDEFEAFVTSRRESGAAIADVRVGEAVPWAFVVAVLDACIGARLYDVRLDGDLALHFLLPNSAPFTFIPGDPDPRDWSTPLALTIGAVAAGVAFGLGRLFPGRRRRERPS